MSKKGIIIASFGSVYQDALEKSIGSIESAVRNVYGDAFVHVSKIDKFVEFERKALILKLIFAP